MALGLSCSFCLPDPLNQEECYTVQGWIMHMVWVLLKTMNPRGAKIIAYDLTMDRGKFHVNFPFLQDGFLGVVQISMMLIVNEKSQIVDQFSIVALSFLFHQLQFDFSVSSAQTRSLSPPMTLNVYLHFALFPMQNADERCIIQGVAACKGKSQWAMFVFEIAIKACIFVHDSQK